jgi:membrane protease YdiL (CAAX protease family)
MSPEEPPSDDDFAARLRGFGPLGILSVLVILAGNLVLAPLSAVLVLVWARYSRTPWREINQAYHYLVGNQAAIPGMLFAMIIGAGFGEETLFRGYMFERLGKVFGPGAGSKATVVLITSVLFGLAHYSVQGLPGAQQGTIFGLVFGTIFAATGRLWMLMCAHASFDLTAYAIIFWDLETRVAHLVFK